MFSSLPLIFLIPIFIVGAIAVWIAGIKLSDTTDVITRHFGIGEAFGGLLFLAITTNLPEIAITGSAALTHNLGLAIGNILGGIAIQTLVIVILDAFGLGAQDPFTYRAASLELVLEGGLVVAVLVIAVMGTQLPSSVIFARITPDGLLITITWIVGLWLLSKSKKDLPWQDKGRAPGRDKPLNPQEKERQEENNDNQSQQNDNQQEKGQQQNKKGQDQKKDDHVGKNILIFLVASIVTLIAGYVLEESSNAIAGHIGLTSVIFGATILAAATSLPEVSTGLASVKLRDYDMAMSDIFGGNAFLPVLFLLADILSGQATLTKAQNSDIYLACLGALLTVVYIYGLIFRPRKQILRMGIDSFVVLLLYILGIVGLIAVVHGK